jgi:hypothetical protein
MSQLNLIGKVGKYLLRATMKRMEESFAGTATHLQNTLMLQSSEPKSYSSVRIIYFY